MGIDKEIKILEPKKSLNKRLWDGMALKPSVHIKLLKIAKYAIKEAKLKELGIKVSDIIITGSIANYNHNDKSDIDLHIVYGNDEEIEREYLDAKKSEINNKYDPELMGFDIEFYFQQKDERHDSNGIFSLFNNEWVVKPKMYKKNIDRDKVKSIFLEFREKINNAIDDEIIDVIDDIKKARKEGLETKEKEYSPENLAFKLLRNTKMMEKAMKMKNAYLSRSMMENKE